MKLIYKLSGSIILLFMLGIGISSCNEPLITYTDEESMIPEYEDSSTVIPKTDTPVTSSEDSKIFLSGEEINEVREYIEFITAYSYIPDFTDIKNSDLNWMAERFFYFSDLADPDNYNTDFDGNYIATVDSLENVLKENVNPYIVIPQDYYFNLDSSLVIWNHNEKVFSWYGRGLPGGFRVSYPVDAYSVDENIYYVSIDLIDYMDFIEDENAAIDIFYEDKHTNAGLYYPGKGEFELYIQPDDMKKHLYVLSRNEDGRLYLVSKTEIE